MKNKLLALAIIITFLSCSGSDNKAAKPTALPIIGTWQLVEGIVIEKGDTTIRPYNKNVSFIKIINNTHFAFLQHDLNKGKDSLPVFVAGGGRYTLKDSTYTEQLEYCSARIWEGNNFTLTIRLRNDTLTQRGIEKVDNAGVDRLNIEKYVRVKE